MKLLLRTGLLCLLLLAPIRGAVRAASPDPAPVPGPAEWWQGDGDPVTGPGGHGGRGATSPRIEIFAKSWQRGHRLSLERPVADVTELGQPVGSLIVKAGSWQLCSRPDFEGECRVVDHRSEKRANGLVVWSLRPVN